MLLPRAAGPVIVLAAVLAGGCVSHVHYPGEGRLVTAASQAPVLKEFEYQRSSSSAPALRETGETKRGYTIHRFSMPASFENGQPDNLVTGTYYESSVAGPRPLVIVLPVWGVSEYPSTRMSRALMKRSHGAFNVLRVDGANRLMAWKRIERSATYEEFVAAVANSAKRLRHAVIDARRLVDWAETRSEIAKDRIGLVGFSVSALSGTLVVQSDPRIRAGALVMGGAKVGAIVSECPGNEQEARHAVMKTLGLDLQEYRETVSALFEGVDPTDHPNRVDPETLLIVDAAKDDCIPRESREAWWEALGRPERISLNYSHRGSFLAMTPLGFNFLRKRIYEHLAETLHQRRGHQQRAAGPGTACTGPPCRQSNSDEPPDQRAVP